MISLFPLSFSGVRFLAFLGGRRHGLMLIHENGRLSIEHCLAGGLCGKLNLLQYFPPVKNDKQRRVDRQLAILAARAARDSGCQEVHRKWESQLKLNRKQGIRGIVTVIESVGSSSRLVLG